MKNVAGIFASLQDAERAVSNLQAAGLSENQISLLAPGASETELGAVPTTDAEPAGPGKAFGGLLGGALGAAAGMHLGATVVSSLLPGVGPVIAVGVAAAALIGTGGAVGGATLGQSLDDAATQGLPTDELFIYEYALRKGHFVVIALPEDELVHGARNAMFRAGAESVDAARENWWSTLRDAEEQWYLAEGEDFSSNEVSYRLGFEAAQRPALRGIPYDAALAQLRKLCSAEEVSAHAFKHGYQRGQAHRQALMDNANTSSALKKEDAVHQRAK
jgi:hypothetical protein